MPARQPGVDRAHAVPVLRAALQVGARHAAGARRRPAPRRAALGPPGRGSHGGCVVGCGAAPAAQARRAAQQQPDDVGQGVRGLGAQPAGGPQVGGGGGLGRRVRAAAAEGLARRQQRAAAGGACVPLGAPLPSAAARRCTATTAGRWTAATRPPTLACCGALVRAGRHCCGAGMDPTLHPSLAWPCSISRTPALSGPPPLPACTMPPRPPPPRPSPAACPRGPRRRPRAACRRPHTSSCRPDRCAWTPLMLQLCVLFTRSSTERGYRAEDRQQ